jgi:hypothetical protein
MPLDQHWTLAATGPDGYIMGRVGLPESDHQLRQIFKVSPFNTRELS